MNPRRILLALALILCGVGTGLMVREWLVMRAAEVEARNAAQRRDAMKVEILALRSALARSKVDATDLKQPPRGRMKANLPPPGDTANARAARQVQLFRAWLALRNAGMYRQLKFTADQIDRFEIMSENHYLRLRDISIAARQENLLNSDPAVRKLYADEDQDFKQQEAGFLGDGLVNDMLAYERTVPVRSLTNALAGAAYIQVPLSADQGDQLTQILANQSVAYQSGHTAKTSDLNFPAAMQQARTVLSPEQLAALQNLYLGQQSGNNLTKLLTTLTQGSVAGK